jgi:restriction endonuclease S subunit
VIGWTETTLGAEIEMAYGKSLPAHTREHGPYDVFGSNGRVGHHTKPLVDGPGIIVGRKGSVGEVVYSERDFWPIDTTYYVVKKGQLDWRFLFHLLSSLGLEKMNSHSAVPGLNREDVYSINVVLPGLFEQAQIAHALDTVQSSLRLEAKAAFLSEELKRATTRAVFARGLRGEAQKETEIGQMPESWTPRTLLELTQIWSGGTPKKSVAEYWNGDIPWVSGKDLKRSALDDAIDHVSQEGIEAGSRLAPGGAVLVLVRGMGLVKDLPIAVINRPMAFNQDVKALVSRGEFTGQFLRSAIYCGKERLSAKIVPSAHGTMTLNLDDLETFKVPCPADASEASEIVAILDAIDGKIDLHRRKHAVLDDLFKSLLHKLMTGEIRVGDLDLSVLSTKTATATETAA